MTPDDLARLRALCEGATKEPWTIDQRDAAVLAADWALVSHSEKSGLGLIITKADAEFIAAAREALPRLLEENARLKEVVECIALVTAYDEPLPGSLHGHIKSLVDDVLDSRTKLAQARAVVKAACIAMRDALAAYDMLPP